MYKLVLTARAKKQLKSFKKSHQLTIALVVEDLKENPYLGKALSRELRGSFTFRVGAYRLIYKVDYQDRIVTILNFDHRGRVYNT